MRSRIRYGMCACLWILLQSHRALGQIPVVDVANLGANSNTAAQTTFISLQTITMIANEILELTGLEGLALGDDYQSDLDDLGAMVEQARGLSYDIASLNAQIQSLFSLDTAPDNARDYAQRMADIRRVVFESYSYAMRTQTLMQTALRTVRHLHGLIASIGDFVGNMSANQTINQVDGTLSATLERLQVQTSAYERAQSVERLTEPMAEESLRRINEATMSDHPR